MRCMIRGLGVVLLVVAALWAAREAATQAADPAADASVERARKTVRMLDDIYKNAIVLITDKYVHDTDDFAAGSAAVELFSAITKKGWHDVRLLDVTGDPYDADNVAQNEFEKQAVEQLKAGKDYVEKVAEQDGKRKLLAMTAVPVVHERCVMCHPHYADVKKGAAIGGISYVIPLD